VYPSTSLVGTFHSRRSRSLKTGFFRQVRELKIQRKNPGSALCPVKLQETFDGQNFVFGQRSKDLLVYAIFKLMQNFI
jgi:hypothetical protein